MNRSLNPYRATPRLLRSALLPQAESGSQLETIALAAEQTLLTRTLERNLKVSYYSVAVKPCRLAK